jgi:hypothetical protein
MVSARAACLALAVLLSCSVPACSGGTSESTPVVEITTVPEAAAGGTDRLVPIAGRVTGAQPGQRIVLFARSQVWWVQPFTVRPFTEVRADGTWENTVHMGTEYAAVLVSPEYKPPVTVQALPNPGGHVAAVAVVNGRGEYVDAPPKRLQFSGYEWDVRQTPSSRGGANDYDPDNVWVEPDGALHLRLRKRGETWTSAELSLTRPLGYGTYAFVVRDTSAIDPAAVLTFLTWDDEGAEQNHRELDVEISRWGDQSIANAQYVVQPYYVAANVFRFTAPAGRVTHTFRWEPGRASFRSHAGDMTREDAEAIASHTFTSGIPVPGDERVGMNLYYFRYAARPPQREVEVVIERFRHLP